MRTIHREFNGKIKCDGVYGFGNMKYGPLKYMDTCLESYMEIIHSHIKSKKVKVIPQKFINGSWYEEPLVRWIILNHRTLGFEDIVLEKTPRYYELKKELGFNKYPDLLVYFEDSWYRLEVEIWAHKYAYCHEKGYADIVYAYDSYRSPNTDVPIFTLKDHFKCGEIISSGEFLEYLYLVDPIFKKDYDLSLTKFFSKDNQPIWGRVNELIMLDHKSQKEDKEK